MVVDEPSNMPRRVVVESPYAGDVERNERYARACMADCLNRREAPFASHLLYTQPGLLDDSDPRQRELGIRAGFAWRCLSTLTVVYTDLGVTDGMKRGIADAEMIGARIEYRTLPGWSERQG